MTKNGAMTTQTVAQMRKADWVCDVEAVGHGVAATQIAPVSNADNAAVTAIDDQRGQPHLRCEGHRRQVEAVHRKEVGEVRHRQQQARGVRQPHGGHRERDDGESAAVRRARVRPASAGQRWCRG